MSNRLNMYCDLSLRLIGFIAGLGILAGCIMIGIYYGKPQVIDPSVGLAGIILLSISIAYEILLLIYCCCTT